jgi:hypothetical protein
MADYLMLSWKKVLLSASLLTLSKATVLGGLITGVTATDDGYFQSHPDAKAVDGRVAKWGSSEMGS